MRQVFEFLKLHLRAEVRTSINTDPLPFVHIYARDEGMLHISSKIISHISLSVLLSALDSLPLN